MTMIMLTKLMTIMLLTNVFFVVGCLDFVKTSLKIRTKMR